ncbi:MAG: mechanosensitive ion channel [Rhodobacteraceae bacterium]|nr:mechanosensitive ion channel [Paracoccaceae bacterium]
MVWLAGILWNVALAFAILAGAVWLSAWVKNRVVAFSRSYDEIDGTLFSFAGSVVRYTIIALAVIFVLARFGIQTTSLIALIGAAGLAIGLALQGTLSNIAAGVMLIIFRPFKVGDFVEVSGGTGTVKEITLLTTGLATADNLKVIIPNRDVFGSAIINYSHYDQRRVDLVFRVGYGADLKAAEAAILQVIKGDDRILDNPQAVVKVSNLGDSSVDFSVRVWVNRPDYFAVKCDLQRTVKEAFDAGGIDIPFPTRTIVNR